MLKKKEKKEKNTNTENTKIRIDFDNSPQYLSDGHVNFLKEALNQLDIEISKRTKSNLDTTLRTKKKFQKSPSLLQDRAEFLQMELANLAVRKQQLEWLILQAERAKEEIQDIDQQFSKKREELQELLKEMKNAEEIDNKLSIVKDSITRVELLKRIPKMKLLKISNFAVPFAKIIGPKDEKLEIISNVIAAKSVSNYPIIDGIRQGDPIADRFQVVYFPNLCIFALADGCGWGSAAQDAASRAVSSFTQYMTDLIPELTSSQRCGRYLLRAFASAHNAILTSTEDPEFAGSTTMLGGLALPLEDKSQWITIFASLGDCKGFHWSCKTGEIKDLTPGSRQTLADVRDPGGRLGPSQTLNPDLRNLQLHCVTCFEDDILSFVSDGIHDNMGT